MILLPAIDIIDGRPVRLYQGDYTRAEQVAEDVTAAALRFKEAGAKYLHCVDLDGAKAGKRMNAAIIKQAALKSGLSTEVGGGIRTMADIEDYLCRNWVDEVFVCLDDGSLEIVAYHYLGHSAYMFQTHADGMEEVFHLL